MLPVDLLVRANAAPYDIARVAVEKLGPGYSGDAVVTGDSRGITVTCGKYLRLIAVDPAHRRRGLGTLLLREAESRGVTVVGAEPGNYFTPGIIDTDHETISFFQNRGYGETARTQNLRTNVGTGFSPSSGVRRAEARRYIPLLTFIEREFGAVWRFEAAKGETIFYIEEDGEIAGFATHEANNRGLGTFGPTGVAEKFRGRGLGRALLQASLADLAHLGYQQVIIPWTDAIDFYRKACGAEIAHKFVILRRIST